MVLLEQPKSAQKAARKVAKEVFVKSITPTKGTPFVPFLDVDEPDITNNLFESYGPLFQLSDGFKLATIAPERYVVLQEDFFPKVLHRYRFAQRERRWPKREKELGMFGLESVLQAKPETVSDLFNEIQKIDAIEFGENGYDYKLADYVGKPLGVEIAPGVEVYVTEDFEFRNIHNNSLYDGLSVPQKLAVMKVLREEAFDNTLPLYEDTQQIRNEAVDVLVNNFAFQNLKPYLKKMREFCRPVEHSEIARKEAWESFDSYRKKKLAEDMQNLAEGKKPNRFFVSDEMQEKTVKALLGKYEPEIQELLEQGQTAAEVYDNIWPKFEKDYAVKAAKWLAQVDPAWYNFNGEISERESHYDQPFRLPNSKQAIADEILSSREERPRIVLSYNVAQNGNYRIPMQGALLKLDKDFNLVDRLELDDSATAAILLLSTEKAYDFVTE